MKATDVIKTYHTHLKDSGERPKTLSIPDLELKDFIEDAMKHGKSEIDSGYFYGMKITTFTHRHDIGCMNSKNYNTKFVW